MKYLAIALLALSLTACKDEARSFHVDTTLTCEMPKADGTVATRTFRYTGDYTAYSDRHNIGWTYGEGAWLVIDRYWGGGGAVYKTVTPLLGESCTPD
jgi:hypothetical protein